MHAQESSPSPDNQVVKTAPAGASPSKCKARYIQQLEFQFQLAIDIPTAIPIEISIGIPIETPVEISVGIAIEIPIGIPIELPIEISAGIEQKHERIVDMKSRNNNYSNKPK